VTISSNLKGNAPLGPAEAAAEKTVAALHLPSTIETGFQGNAQAFQASLSSEPILILAALVAVYIILGMLCENVLGSRFHWTKRQKRHHWPRGWSSVSTG